MVRISSFNTANHVSCKECISKASKSFCSCGSLSTHAFLSNFCVGAGAPRVEKAETVEIEDGGCGGTELGVGEDLGCELKSASSFTTSCLEIGDEAGCFGAAKKEVMVAFAFGFFESEPATSAAFRFKDVDILNIERMLAVHRFFF